MESLLRVENLRVEAKVGPERYAAIVTDVTFPLAPRIRPPSLPAR